jgi:benzoyl-CoA reductase/2-hydroxyglutaryl-CoA dehydratase subunit BcrC/BadD/HgdB
MAPVRRAGVNGAGVIWPGLESARGRKPHVVGITALVPPEMIYSAGWYPMDVNNWIPGSAARPRSKLCAWTASWREAILNGKIALDALVVVAGGDCHNALADGQAAARKVDRTHYFFYPFDGDTGYLKEQLTALEAFLGEGRTTETAVSHRRRALEKVASAKVLGLRLDRARSDGKAGPERTFKLLVSFSDLEGDPVGFERKLREALADTGRQAAGDRPRVALIGVPPIYRDFHRVCAEAGLQVVFDELPYEFLRLGGTDPGSLARSYSTYTFARPVEYRLDFLERELKKRRIDGIIHYAQFTCHHLLEDGMLRERLDWPMLTIQGDLPGETPAQVRLRLEAFGELLSGKKGAI